jgi:PAS domain S-box-containing protein
MEQRHIILTGITGWDGASDVFELLPDLYLILSPDLRILKATNAYVKAIGTEKDLFEGANAYDVFKTYGARSEGFEVRLDEAIKQLLERGIEQEMEVEYLANINTQGKQEEGGGYFQIQNFPVLDNQHNVQYIIHKLNDVTAVVKNAQDLKNLAQRDLGTLGASEELLSKAEEAGSTGSYKLDLHTQELRISNGMYKLLGYGPQGITPTLQFLNSISYKGDDSVVNNIINDAILTNTPYQYVRRIFHPNGEMRYILSKGKVINDAQGDPSHILGVSHDITEQVRAKEQLFEAHEALKKSNDLLQSIFNTTLIGMSLLSPVRNTQGEIVDFTIMLVSKELENETKRTDLAGKSYLTEYPGIKASGLYDRMLKVMETGKPEHLEYYYPFDGFDKWFSCTFVKMDDGLVASNLDITPTKQAEAKIRALEENQKLEIYKACISTQEEERKRIAEDLRNGIGQILYAAKINLRHVEAEKALNDLKGFEQAKQYTDKILTTAINEIRKLSNQMTPAILEDFGLEETIIELCKQFKPDINVRCKVTYPSTRLENYFEVSVYRMVQELLVNVVKHAKATEAIIDVCAKGNTLEVMVQDNGQGFNPDLAMKKCLGLSTLVNKVHLLNGAITINTDHGTKVNIVLPIKQKE